jgi:hypothetical protein
MIHQKFRVFLYDLKVMVPINDLDFENHILHYTGSEDPGMDHAASEIMEWTGIYCGILSHQELWENDVVRIKSLLSTNDYFVQWNFNRFILRHRTKNTIKEITASALATYQIIGNIYQ